MALNLTNVIKFTDQLETPVVSFAHGRCLRSRHKEAPCDLCMGACPTQAITAGSPVSLDTGRCVACGLCLHICPTGAFSKAGSQAGKLLEVMSSLDADQVELACPRKSEITETRCDAEVIVEVKPCLAALSLPTLLALVTRRMAEVGRGSAAALWINDEPCENCPIGFMGTEIYRTAEAANRLLAAFSVAPKVRTYQSSPELLAKKGKIRPVFEGDRPRYSRRQFLRSWSRFVEQASDDAPVDSPPPKPTSKKADNDQQFLPESRSLLIRSLRRMGEPTETYTNLTKQPFGSVSINGDCTACGLCARFCPTKALVFEEETGAFKLSFTTSQCVGCAICELICPTGAVVMAPGFDMAKLLAETADVIASGDLVACHLCGMPCAADKTEPICFVCQRQKTAVTTAFR